MSGASQNPLLPLPAQSNGSANRNDGEPGMKEKGNVLYERMSVWLKGMEIDMA